MRALLGNASHIFEVVVLKPRTVKRINQRQVICFKGPAHQRRKTRICNRIYYPTADMQPHILSNRGYPTAGDLLQRTCARALHTSNRGSNRRYIQPRISNRRYIQPRTTADIIRLWISNVRWSASKGLRTSASQSRRASITNRS